MQQNPLPVVALALQEPNCYIILLAFNHRPHRGRGGHQNKILKPEFFLPLILTQKYEHYNQIDHKNYTVTQQGTVFGVVCAQRKLKLCLNLLSVWGIVPGREWEMQTCMTQIPLMGKSHSLGLQENTGVYWEKCTGGQSLEFFPGFYIPPLDLLLYIFYHILIQNNTCMQNTNNRNALTEKGYTIESLETTEPKYRELCQTFCHI